MQKPLSVVVVEDDRSTRETLCAGIAAQSGMEVAAVFEMAAPAIAWLEFNLVDVLLIDLGLPDRSGIEVIAACAAWRPHCDILVITMFGDEKNVLDSIDAGAKGYILKDADDFNVARFIGDLRQGGSPMSSLVARKLLQRAKTGVAPPKTSGPVAGGVLSRREIDALDLIARGYTYGEVAGLMGVSINTVQTHMKRIYAKLAVHSSNEAVFEAQKKGLLRAGLFKPDVL